MRAIFDCEKCRTNAFSRREKDYGTQGTLKETQPETVFGRKTNPTAKRTQPRTASRRKTKPRNESPAQNEAKNGSSRRRISDPPHPACGHLLPIWEKDY